MAGVILHHPQGDEPCLTQTGDGCIDGFHQWKNPPIRRKPSRNPPVENWVENSVTLLQTNIDVEKPPFKLIVLRENHGFSTSFGIFTPGYFPLLRIPTSPPAYRKRLAADSRVLMAIFWESHICSSICVMDIYDIYIYVYVHMYI